MEELKRQPKKSTTHGFKIDYREMFIKGIRLFVMNKMIDSYGRLERI